MSSHPYTLHTTHPNSPSPSHSIAPRQTTRDSVPRPLLPPPARASCRSPSNTYTGGHLAAALAARNLPSPHIAAPTVVSMAHTHTACTLSSCSTQSLSAGSTLSSYSTRSSLSSTG